MRKIDKLGLKETAPYLLPASEKQRLAEIRARAVTRLTRTIAGRTVTFTVTYQNSRGPYPAKIIDVSDGVGSGPTFSWTAALAYAAHLCALRGTR